MNDERGRQGSDDSVAERRKEAAVRALNEAAERRGARPARARHPAEIQGREGADPVRYGDWEVKGLAVDF